ncbi:transporter substrate-binding domain-containing protein [Xanthomonas theicola]|uniref:ArtI protein n=1 Tax=Xanthomonas theicola TaxID=56464 RepID=A0A2S6ZK51_9XANT|nr:transporter substrate-binding domain-containing protein [Xanthomonas theicola]PPT92643.1 ArtI protein [Xanthomonas theicola]QNH26164.1 transporter substrate-binding domain-containing protein [Xanthomonas theicola]
MIRCLAACLLSAAAALPAPAAASQLDAVVQRGTLRVCTTGDYAPYSRLRADGGYEGIDIALAQSLAASLEATVQWVPTRWPTLLPDLLADRCDIAVGGISISLPRQRQAWFSAVLEVDGKIPLVRCADRDRYRDVARINRADVRVIEPRGGTNEAFARRELPLARLTVLDDNAAIFGELLEGRADVMITDASEARFQQRRRPGLCAVDPPRPLQYGEKAFLLPRGDIAWKAYVDQWLHLSKASGEYARTVAAWLGDDAPAE